MANIIIDEAMVTDELVAGLRAIRNEFAYRFAGQDGLRVAFERLAADAGHSLHIQADGTTATVRYKRKTDAFRALGRLLGADTDHALDPATETCRFDMLGVMMDASRNAVLLPEAARSLLCRFAMMGINVAMLYAEDTYEVPGEPWFGYLRGRYTHDELVGLDRFAGDLGIEMFPCIQTLGHMGQALQWPALAEHRDTGDVLLADDDKTYTLIEKMITAASTPFQSNRIHVGMDEASGIGRGRYRALHGEKPPLEIFNRHLCRVSEICRRLGLKPMIWSDMYFSLGSESGDYYDEKWSIPGHVLDDVPRDVQLIYWDYYHHDTAFYERHIDRHRQLGGDPIMAGGVWTWNRFWSALPYTFHVNEACMQACKTKKLREVFVTMWGDDGAEGDIFSCLAGVQFFAEHGYHDEVNLDAIRANFRGSCDADFDDWCTASELDAVPWLDEPARSIVNVSKALLWQDPLLPLFDPQVQGCQPRKHYAQLADRLFAACKKTPGAARLELPARVAQVLSLKCELRDKLRTAYLAGDRKQLRCLLDEDINSLVAAARALYKYHRATWLKTNKPFGLEVLEQRYGGQCARLESMRDRLADYLSGDADTIAELDEMMLRIHDHFESQNLVINHGRAVTPSRIR